MLPFFEVLLQTWRHALKNKIKDNEARVNKNRVPSFNLSLSIYLSNFLSIYLTIRTVLFSIFSSIYLSLSISVYLSFYLHIFKEFISLHIFIYIWSSESIAGFEAVRKIFGTNSDFIANILINELQMGYCVRNEVYSHTVSSEHYSKL